MLPGLCPYKCSVTTSLPPESIAPRPLIRVQVECRDEPRYAIFDPDRPHSGVNRMVMMRAQQRCVDHRCWAVAFPRVHMVGIAPRGWDRAVWGGASAIPSDECSALIRCEKPGLPTRVQDGAV